MEQAGFSDHLLHTVHSFVINTGFSCGTDKICVMITVMKTGTKRKLEIKTWEIKTDRLKRTDGSLRIVFLADLHDRLWGEGQEQLLEAIDSLKADLILGAGDMLVAKEHAVKMEHALFAV